MILMLSSGDNSHQVFKLFNYELLVFIKTQIINIQTSQKKGKKMSTGIHNHPVLYRMFS